MLGRKSLGIAIGAGALVGTFCGALTFIPWIADLEQDVGLRWLFQLRGALPPPQEVVIVAMNRQSATNIYLPKDSEKFHRCRDMMIGSAPRATHENLPEMPGRWPRCLHANLVDRLSAAGAQVIAFDVLFRKRPPQTGSGEDVQKLQDLAMAKAFAFRRVVIAQDLEDFEGGHRLIELSPAISQATLGSAPFPMVKKARFDKFAAFVDTEWATPTLPALALQAHALDTYPLLAALLADSTSDGNFATQLDAGDAAPRSQLEVFCLMIRHAFRQDPLLAERVLARIQASEPADTPDGMQRPRLSDLSADEKRRFRAVVAMYAGEADRFINFYGPAGTLSLVGYDVALNASTDRMRDLFRDRVVFVGYAEPARFKQTDHFSTVFSPPDTPDLSGVEIAATAFSNLLHDSTIRRLSASYWVTLIFAFAFMTTVVGRTLQIRHSIPIVTVAIAGFAGMTFQLFAQRMIWIPYMVPLFVATPAGFLAALTWNFETTRRQRENIRRALANFIPPEVVDQFERNAEGFGATKQELDCGCVATDAANYTPLAENMAPGALSDFLNQYFDALFRPVGTQGGFVSDVVGDAMLAIWPHRSAETHAGMLTALIQMRDAARHFNERFAENRLMTRFGVDWGPVALATMGAHRHYEYRAVGDTVNTASRIQELNKKLGTTVLLSRRSVGPAADVFLLRDLGCFMLRGKRIPVEICELIEIRSAASIEQRDLCSRFAMSLEVVYHGAPALALAAFRELHAAYPRDGPTAFYLELLQSDYGLVDGVVRVN